MSTLNEIDSVVFSFCTILMDAVIILSGLHSFPFWNLILILGWVGQHVEFVEELVGHYL